MKKCIKRPKKKNKKIEAQYRENKKDGLEAGLSQQKNIRTKARIII
jgi:hypothetical protein